MKITYSKSIPTTRFMDIEVGQCFIDRDGDISIKVSNEIYNAFCFVDKKLWEFYPDSDVVPVEVELIVHAEER